MTENTTLEVKTEAVGTCQYRVSVAVPPLRVNQEIEEVLRAAGRRVRVPGFRPGHVPLGVLRKVLGAGIQADVKEHFVEHVVNDALRQSGLEVFRVLELEAEKIEVQEGQPSAFSFQVETVPAITLPAWDEVALAGQPTAAGAEQIEAALGQLSREHARFEPIAGQALDEEHLVVCDLRFRRGDVLVTGAEGLRLGLGSPLYGADPARFVDLMRGVLAGEERVVPVQFHEGFSEASWVGSAGEALVAVREVVKPRLASAEEIAADLKLEGAGVLRERVAEQLGRQNELAERDRLVHELLESLGRSHPFELPERLLADEVAASLRNHAERLEKQNGLSAEAAAEKAKEAEEQIREEAARRLRHYFLVRRVAAAEGIQVRDADMRTAFQALGERHQVPADAVAAYYAEQGMTGRLRNDILEGKVRARLAQIAKARAAGESAAAVAAGV